MMKRLLLLSGFCALTFLASAQGSKSVNAIKRSSQYLYAEATMDTVQDAYEVAKELLIGNIKEYASEKKAFRDKDILVKDIASHCDSIQLRRGEMYKVFLYVKKDDIQGVKDNLTVIGETALAPAGLLQGPAEASETVEPQDEGLDVNPENSTIAGDASLLLPGEWQQDVIDKLLEAPSYEKARALVNRFRAETKIKRAGPEETCKDRSACYWLVGYEGGVVTVLGPGTGERTDFKNLTKTTMEYYQGLDLYWFTLAK